MPPERGGNIFIYMITVIKVVDTSLQPARIHRIYDSIFARASGYYKDDEGIEFIEKNTREHLDWINENKINSYPTTIFYKDNEMIAIGKGIMASTHIMEVIEPYIPKLESL